MHGPQGLTVVLGNTTIRGDRSGRTEPSFPEEASEVAALQRVGERGLAGPRVAEELDLHAAQRCARRHQLLHEHLSPFLENNRLW